MESGRARQTGPSDLIAVDADASAYICGQQTGGESGCVALRPGSQDPLWRVLFDKGETLAGGALVPGRLYVAWQDGYLYALGDG